MKNSTAKRRAAKVARLPLTEAEAKSWVGNIARYAFEKIHELSDRSRVDPEKLFAAFVIAYIGGERRKA